MKSCMRIAVIPAAVLVVLGAAGASAGGDTGLTHETIEKLKESFELDPATRSIMNAVTNNDVSKLTLNRELLARHNDVFNVKVDTKGVTDQESSGRCWLFAGFNIMRPSVMKKFNIDDFEFSENHLFFWDKLEKANMFLEAMIENRGKDVDDRELKVLFRNPVPDGGWWTYVVNLIGKYGAVPKCIMPETKNSSNTRRMNSLLNRMMRSDAAEIRRLASEGKDESTLRKRKFEMLSQVYRLLAIHLGIPPEEFVWRYEDKDGRVCGGTYTPLSFYTEAVEDGLDGYVTLLSYPVHGYYEYYRIRYCRNMPDAPDMDFINMDIGMLKEFALKAVLGGEPVWFAADVGKDHDVENGIFEIGIHDYRTLIGVEDRITKADRLLYCESTPNHAMVFIGADTLGGRASKWLVENSWGTDRGKKGFWTMYDDWFDEHVFGVIVHKRYLPGDVLAIMDTEPKVLPAWDPMRSLFE